MLPDYIIAKCLLHGVRWGAISGEKISNLHGVY